MSPDSFVPTQGGGRQASVGNSRLEDGRQHPVSNAHRRGGEGATRSSPRDCGQPLHERLHIGRQDTGDGPITEHRVDVPTQDALDLDDRALTVDLSGSPLFGILAHGDPTGLGVHVLPSDDAGLRLVQPALSIHPASEVSRMLPASLVAIARSPLPVFALLDARHVAF